MSLLVHPLSPYTAVGEGHSFAVRGGSRQFNRGIKRDPTILVTGDRARFALMRTLPEDLLDPDLIKLGDGRVRLVLDGRTEWLDTARDASTLFLPHGTAWSVCSSLVPDLTVDLLVTQAENWGLVAQVSLTNNGSFAALELQVEISFGGLARCGRTDSAAYFRADDDDPVDNRVVVSGKQVTFSSPAMPDRVVARSLPACRPVLSGAKAIFTLPVLLQSGETRAVCLVAGHSGAAADVESRVAQAAPADLLEECTQYYARLLRSLQIDTPSVALNSGFRTAILNLEYDYAAPAWLEGFRSATESRVSVTFRYINGFLKQARAPAVPAVFPVRPLFCLLFGITPGKPL